MKNNDDVLKQIFDYLTVGELTKIISLVSKKWHQLAYNDVIWKNRINSECNRDTFFVYKTSPTSRKNGAVYPSDILYCVGVPINMTSLALRESGSQRQWMSHSRMDGTLNMGYQSHATFYPVISINDIAGSFQSLLDIKLFDRYENAKQYKSFLEYSEWNKNCRYKWPIFKVTPLRFFNAKNEVLTLVVNSQCFKVACLSECQRINVKPVAYHLNSSVELVFKEPENNTKYCLIL